MNQYDSTRNSQLSINNQESSLKMTDKFRHTSMGFTDYSATQKNEIKMP